MAYHGAIMSRGRAQRIFIIRDSNKKGFHWGVGERAGLVELRKVPVGARVYIAFLGRRETGNVIDGERQTIMDFDVVAEHLLDAPVAVAMPTGGSGGGSFSTPPGSDEDIPF